MSPTWNESKVDFVFVSVSSQIWQLECPESQKTDRRANNYLSQVAAVIVGGWKMSEEGSVCVYVCVCVCVCVSENSMSF